MHSSLLFGAGLRRTALLLLFALLTFGLARPAAATHLRGGELRYRYLDATGTVPGRPFRYELTFSVYYSCEGNSNFPCGRPLIGVSIYDKSTGLRIDDLNNPGGLQMPNNCPATPMGGPSNAPPNSFPLFNIGDSIVTAAPQPGCLIVAGCALVVRYQAIVELPPSGALGYAAVYSDNARNASVTNIATGMGQGAPQVLQIDIPRPVTANINSSPLFSDSPVPLLCARDTISIINNAFDAEGDRLLYSFYQPFGGPAMLGPTYVAPTGVTYAAGYSLAQPFGVGGSASINPLNGQTTYYVPNAGEYVVGVQVSEFRTINGVDVLLSTIYREIQLQIKDCSPVGQPAGFPPPALNPSLGQNISIEEGQSTQFVTTGMADTTSHTITLSAASQLLDGPAGFNATFENQPGTAANQPVTLNGVGQLTGTFRFTSICGSAGVYPVIIKVVDLNACPLKDKSATYTITVRRPGAPTAITGDNTVCPNTTASYTATGAPANTASYQWTVTGGTIQGSATGATVTVLWNTVGTQSLSAKAISPLGCLSNALALSVEVFAGATATLSGLNAAYCLDPTAPGTPLVGSPTGGTFSITGPGGTTNLVNGVFTPRVAGTFQLTYTVSNANGCAATSTPFTVVVNPLPVVLLAASLPATVCSNDAPITLAGTVNGSAATTGFTIDGIAATIFNPGTLATGAHVVVLTGTGVGACIDTARRTVTVNAAPTVLLTGLQASYCQNAPAVTLTATANNVPITGANAVFTIDAAPATQLNPATLAVGFHTVRVLGTGPNACRDTDSLRFEIKVLPSLAITGLNAAYCKDAAPVPLAGTVDATAGGTFTIDGIAATVFNPAALSAGPHLVVFSGTGVNTCQDTLHRTVRVNPLPVVRIVAPTATTFCLNAPVVTLTGNAPGQFFIDANPTAVTSFLPSALGVGAHIIRFTRTELSTGCTNDTTLTITIRPLPVLAITGLQTAYCADAAPVTLAGTVDNVAGGTFTIDGIAATVLNPATLTPGPHQVIFLGTGTNGCATTDTATVQINALPTVAITGLNPAYCVGVPVVTLAGTVNASTTVGTITFTVNGNPSTSFDPSTLPPGTYTVVATGTLTATGCRNTTTQTVVINALPTVAITNLNPAYCVNAPAVSLTSVLTGGTGTVTYTINGTTATTFNPATLGPGTYTVVVTGTVTATTCQGSATQTVVVNALPTVAINGLAPAYCQSFAPVPLSATVVPFGPVVFTVNGTTATSFDPGILPPGTYTVVATGTAPATGCQNTATQTVVINALPTVTITNLNPAYCLSSPAVTLAATVSGGGTTTFTINNNAATSFDPAALGVGTYTVVATGTDPNTCQNSTTRTVVVNALPTVAITGLNPAYCIGAPAVPLTGTVNGAAGTVTFTIDGNAATSFNPGTLTVGPHVVVATGTDGNTCQNTTTQTVTINALPTVAITGLNPAYCQGDAPVTLGGTVTNNGTITFTVNNQPATVFDPTTLAPGTYTVVATGTDANTCVASATQTVVINARPTVTITGLNPAYCVSAGPVTLTGTVTGGTGTTTFTIDGNGATILDPATLTPGSHVVVATGVVTATGCQNTATQTVTINALPTVAITGLNPAYCQGDPTVTLTGTVSGGGTTTFTLNGNPATSFDPNTLAPGTYTIIATGTDGNTCANTATQTVTINPRPTGILPTGPPSVCPGLTGVPYSLTGAPGQTFTWTVVGGTVASGQGTANITVDFGPANPNAAITVVTVDGGTNCRSLPATLPVIVNQVLATQTPAGVLSSCVNAGPQTFSIPIPSPLSVYNWTLTPAGAGTITAGQGTASITVTFTQTGPVTLVVTETSITPLANCFGTSAPLSVTVLPAPDPTLTIQSSASAACATGAPVTFTLPGGAGSTYQWTVDGIVQSATTGGAFSFPATTAGTYTIGAQETNVAGCVGPVITTPLTVNPVPTAATIAGSATLCPQGLTNQAYSVTGLPNSTFQWTVTGGTIIGGQGTPTVTVDFDGSAAPTLSVTETSTAGCAGPVSPIALTLDIAAPSLTLATVDEAQPANQIDLNLGGLNAQPGTTLLIQRRVSGSGAFAQVGTVAAPATTFTDPNVDPSANAYDYRVDLTNACGTLLQSVEHTTVRVEATGTEASGDVTLTWNEYRGERASSYDVLRKNASGGYDVLGSVTAGTTTYTATGVGRDAFNQTFRIRAVLVSNALVSYSNETAVTFTNTLQGYNIITPNGDGKNDRFVIENAALYPTNELAVFNRWGREVYRRKNYDNSWNGGDLTAGTYYYLFTANGKSYKSWVEIVK